MLIRFIVENFSSFCSQAELSMVAGRQEIHPLHLIQSPENGFKLLRTGVIYGANASGKSNLIKAMAFAKGFIVHGTAPMARIPVRPFLLDAAKRTEPSVFQFSFCHNNGCYTYGFKVTAEKVIEEWLSQIVNEKENILFNRTTDAEGNANIKFAKQLISTADDRNFLSLIARGTRPNQLFLTESVQRNVKQFQPVWEWFTRRLIIVFPEMHALGLEFAFRQRSKIVPLFMNLLRMFDTGILDLDTQEMSIDSALPDIPEKTKSDLEASIPSDNHGVLIAGPSNIRYAVRRNEKGELVAIKLQARHPVRGSNEYISFDFTEESDGTQRLLDLIPVMTSLLSDDNVVIVDEIDRSLHPHVTYALFNYYLNSGTPRKSQLIATTHAENLLTFKLLRKDEIWMIEKNKDGESRLYSLEEFKPRYDKDIMSGYMNGRFGAVPSIFMSQTPVMQEN
jgi:AAA15 family ATPase/GTPase